MLKVILALLGALTLTACAHAQPQQAASSTTQFTNLRQEVFVFEANNAVTAAVAGKRPSQWSPLLMDLYHAGKAKPAACVKVAVLWFTNMQSYQGGTRTEQRLPEGAVYDVARHDEATRQAIRTGEKIALVRRSVVEPGIASPRHFQELTLPLQGGIGEVYIPEAAIKASDNPVLGIALPGFAIRGLPEGNDSGLRASVAGIPESKDGIRWSTPRNAEFGTQNELHVALARHYHNNVAVFVVPPCN